MTRYLTSRAANRIRWYDELSAVLEDGERVLGEMISSGVGSAETEGLRLRLIALRADLGRLNRISLTEERIVGPAWPDKAAGTPAA